MVNQPRRPCTHRAAVSAPRANADRSRAECVSTIVSAGPSNPTVCVPGMNPARVDDTSIGLAKPAPCIACFRSNAVPDGASFFAAVMRFVQVGAELVLGGEQSGRPGHNRLEDDDAGRKIRRRDHADAGVGDRASHRRLIPGPAGRADHGVDAEPRERLDIRLHGIRKREIDRHVDSAAPPVLIESAGVRGDCGSTTPTISQSYSGARSPTIRPMRP